MFVAVVVLVHVLNIITQKCWGTGGGILYFFPGTKSEACDNHNGENEDDNNNSDYYVDLPIAKESTPPSLPGLSYFLAGLHD